MTTVVMQPLHGINRSQLEFRNLGLNACNKSLKVPLAYARGSVNERVTGFCHRLLGKVEKVVMAPMKRVKAQWLLLLVMGLASRPVSGQVTGSIIGQVTDMSGAGVPNVLVRIVNTSTSFSRPVTTNENGQYAAYSLPTGPYQVTVEAQGFDRLVRTGITVTAAAAITVDIQLHVGDVKESIEVKAEAPLLQSETAAVSNLVTSRQIGELPLVSRDFTNLVLLTPGAHAGSGSNLAEGGSPYAMRAGANYAINGAMPQANSYLIDGVYNRNMWLNTLVMVPVVDAIQEYRVMTSNYAAEYGEAAGAVTVVETKSGSNEFHGAAWEFLRNDKLNANTFFNNRRGVGRPPFHRNEFGALLGGPIVRNKLFFFGDYQGIRLSQPVTLVSTIPTLAQQQMVATGDFSGMGVQIYNPYVATAGADGKVARAPFPGNRIPQTMLDPAAVRLFKLLPAPTSAGSTNNFIFNPAQTQNTDQFDLRGDYNAGGSDRIFFKYGYDKSEQVVPGAIPAPANAGVPIGPYLATNANAIQTPLFNQLGTVGYTKLLGPNTVSETHFGVVRWNARITPLGNAFNSATALGIPGININDKSGGLPSFAITGYQVLGDNSTYPEFSQITTFQLDSSVTAVRGSHTLKAGILFLRHRFNGFSAFPARGAYDFNGQFTRQIGSTSSQSALADFAVGAPDSINRNILVGTFGMRQWTLAPFVSDSWRISSRLSLELGFRWEIDAPPYEVHDHWSNLDVKTGLIELAGQDGNSRRLRNIDLNTPAPRAGITYALTSDRKTIFRSGFGISYVNMVAGGAQLYKNPPYFFSQTIATDIAGTPPVLLSNGLPVPVPPNTNDKAGLSSGSFNVWDESLRQTAMLQWSAGVQRELRSDLVLDVSYVGTRGERLLVNSVNLNQSFPGPGGQGPRRPYYSINPKLVNVSYRTNAGDSKYESLQVRLDKRLSHGLQFGVAYTYSSYLSDVGLVNPAANSGNFDIQNHRCIACNWGPTPDDYAHILTVNHVFELPFGPGRTWLKGGIVSQVLRDWSIDGIWNVRSASHFTPILGTNISNSAGGGSQRPNRQSDGNLPSGQRTIDHWFDTSAFAAPAAYTFGNSGTGIIRGPGFFQSDISLVRHFAITERVRLRFQMEAFNAFNRANFDSPNATIGTAQAGVISSTQPARIVQVAAKVLF
mgnify:CR=1 FL=1